VYLLQRSYEDVKSGKYSSHFLRHGERAFERKVQSFGHLYFGQTNVVDPEHTVVMAKPMKNSNNNNNRYKKEGISER